MSSPPQSSGQRPQRPKSAAQRASEANTRQQLAVRTNSPRPSDRHTDDLQEQNDHKGGAPAKR
jgi:hypothetical protein